MGLTHPVTAGATPGEEPLITRHDPHMVSPWARSVPLLDMVHLRSDERR